MDDFVRNKLNEWRLSKWLKEFEEHGIDEESFCYLGEQEINVLIPQMGPQLKFKKRLELLKEARSTANHEAVDSSAQAERECEEAANSVQAGPSTSDTRKRKSDLQGESSASSSPKRRHDTTSGSNEENRILSAVKGIMQSVKKILPKQDNNNSLSAFLKSKIRDLEIEKTELVGVFGQTGAGKSSLINAVIEKQNLLPSGSIDSCTSVMIKVEANRLNNKYEADIEFISKEDWEDELWFFDSLGDDADQETDQDTKMSALYGKEWRNIPKKNLLDDKYFKGISKEFSSSTKKTLTCDSIQKLSAELAKYTRSDDGEGQEGTRWYWPLVKCVTVRVPNNPFVDHVTLVDLPGTNDRNKGRNDMWKEFVGNCSTVWIVTEIKRAASEKEPWEILESVIGSIGNGGQCQQIHFICTKSDEIGYVDETTNVRAEILKRNGKAKERVREEFNKLSKVKKHFSDNNFEAFTVSSNEFLKGRLSILSTVETEIPELQEFLKNLNDRHSVTLNYVSGAHGILSLIQGARRRGVADQKTNACKDLKKNLKDELEKVKVKVEEACEAFEKCLNEGVENSKRSCEGVLRSVIYPENMDDGAFHKTMKCLVKHDGTHKPKKGELIQLNVKLASGLTDSIDGEFKKTFPNDRNSGPFSGVIKALSLDTEKLIKKYRDVELQLIFLKTEEEKIKTTLDKIVRERKKKIYSSLTETIEKNMQDCYERAKAIDGLGSLNKQRATLKEHVRKSKNTMFDEAKDVMLEKLRGLKEDILEKLEKTMLESIELSLRTDNDSIPDFAEELEEAKKYLSKLKKAETKMICTDSTRPAVALSP